MICGLFEGIHLNLYKGIYYPFVCKLYNNGKYEEFRSNKHGETK